MTRKDTILIAVLINAGLLIVLFVTAVKPSSLPEAVHIAHAAPKPSATSENFAAKSEVDQMLTAVQSLPKEEIKKEEIPQEPKKEFLPISSFQKAENSAKASLPLDNSAYKSVIVKAGDALEKIAKAHQISVKEIMQINHLQDSRLQIGQVLYLPEALPSEKKEEEEVKKIPKDEFYIVKNGDNPWTIASKNRIKVEELLRLNQLDEEKARRLKPGDRLRIR